jgi:hypothetical protein
MDNLSIWGAVEKTEPSATKQSQVSGRTETSINGTYMFKRATEQFGPCGIGWGYEIAEERMDRGAPIQFDAEGNPIEYSETHTIKLRFWYKLGEDFGSILSYGHTQYKYMAGQGDNRYMRVDGEAPKKSLTDAIKKALSMLGFSADIFMGQFDDREYVQEQVNAELLKKADDKDEEALRQRKEYEDWKSNNLAAMQKAVSLNELQGLYKAAVRKMDRRGDNAGVIYFTDVKDEVKAKLEAADEAA